MKLGMVVAVAVCSIALSGCAARIMKASQDACSGYGFSTGTDSYAQCVQQEVARRDAAINQALIRAGSAMQGAGAALQQPYQQQAQPYGGGAAQGMAFLKGSYISGMNRVCLYNRLGSAVAITIGSTELCPLSLP
jgi:hypothetical protein